MYKGSGMANAYLQGTYAAEDLEVRQTRLYGTESQDNMTVVQSMPCGDMPLAQIARDTVIKEGFALLSTQEPMASDRFIHLAQCFGEPLVEISEDIHSYVDQSVILHVREFFKQAPDKTLEPFSRNAVLAHTENSASPLSRRPSFLIFSCLEAQMDDSPTFLMPMSGIEAALSETTKDILRQTFYDEEGEELPPIMRLEGGRSIFSYRDFFPHPLQWKCADTSRSVEEVNNALCELLTAVYTVPCIATHWSPGDIMILDNKKFFHAKPVSRSASAELRRHLLRIRVV